MIFFDELDAMVPNRGGNNVGHHYASEVNEFLVQLNQAGENRVLVIGATNLPDRIYAAVRRPGLPPSSTPCPPTLSTTRRTARSRNGTSRLFSPGKR
jgi:SpoVK/Ycf46/Vps4 family AAA+-type ATPase